MFSVEYKDNTAVLTGIKEFDLAQTLDCGQAFRWSDDGNGRWHGVAFNRCLEIEKADDRFIFHNTTPEDFENLWREYFDLDRDYGAVISDISGNEILRNAAQYGRGIRILSQEPWETLCSFIISQNNNIPRIKGIIERLCSNFGEICGNSYTFPTAEKISVLTTEDLAPLRCGFRAKYIIDAAIKVANGDIDLAALKTADTETARNTLMNIKGVGPKVADCTLLFGLGHISAFPRDVWIKRAMQDLFDGELPACALPYAGIVQQYIFYYTREHGNK